MGRWLLAFLIVLVCATDVRAADPLPSMAGWSRVPDLQFMFERDYKACAKHARPVPQLLKNGQVAAPSTEFNECMRGLGWEKK
jgi:hypothetical protein